MLLKNEALQEKYLQQAQKQLEKIRKLEEKAKLRVELEMKRLESIRNGQEDPHLPHANVQPDASIPSEFQSQYTQFSDTLSNQRLDGSRGNELKPLNSSEGKSNRTPSDVSWTSLSEYPGYPVFVSGKYIESARNHTPVRSSREYEYKLDGQAYPISVGDRMIVPVHSNHHSWGSQGKTVENELIYEITRIYSPSRFSANEDDIAKTKLL